MPRTARKPAAKPVRSMRYDAETETLCLFRGTEGTAFAVFELPATEAGRRTFRLGKYDLSEKYTVSVFHGKAECDCPAGTYRDSCRHGDAVLSLVQLGQL
jgi:hypothetical protein